MLPFKLAETTLRRNATDKSWERGQQYYHSGSVVEVVCRGHLIQAEVEGNEYEPYRVSLHADRGGIKFAECSCPYDFEGWCKHIIAVGLTCARDPKSVEEAAPLADLLSPLDREQLEALVVELVDEHPQLIKLIEIRASRLNVLSHNTTTSPASSTSPRQRKTNVDPAPFKRQTQQMIRDGVRACEDGWDDYDISYGAFPELLATPEGFIEQGDGANALVILIAITEACVANWGELEDYGYDGHIAVRLLDPLWAEALLQIELDGPEVIDQQIQLEKWGDALCCSFDLATAALRQGWDDEDLKAVLVGEQDLLWADEAPDYADDLAQIRLRILARQDRWDEYLNFAQREGQNLEYLVKLVELGRGEEALALVGNLGSVQEAQALAEALRDQDDLVGALRVVEHGLRMPVDDRFGSEQGVMTASGFVADRSHYALAVWGGQLAEQFGDFELAIQFWLTAVQSQPELKDFQHLEAVAAEEWPSVQEKLLDFLENHYRSWIVGEEVQIFLASGRVQAAIKRVEKARDREIILEVMRAAIAIDPSWVIGKARVKSEEILDRGKAHRYDWVVKFLGQMRAAYRQQNDEGGWQRERAALMEQHGRKYKFVGLMKGAGL